MNFDQLPFAMRHRLTVAITSPSNDGPPPTEDTLCWIRPNERADDALLQVGSRTWSIDGADDANSAALRTVIERQFPRLSAIARGTDQDGVFRLVVDVAEYPDELSTPEPMEIGVDSVIVAEVCDKHLLRAATLDDVLSWLTDALILAPPDAPGGLSYTVLSKAPRGRGIDGDAFRIFGPQVAVDVRRDSHKRLTLTRIVRAPRRGSADEERGRVILVHSALRFVDIETASQWGGAVEATLKALVESGASYLDFWKQYNQAEEDLLLRNARRLGHLSFTRRESFGAGRWRFFTSRNEDLAAWRRRLSSGGEDELEAAHQLPPELTAARNEPGRERDASADKGPDRRVQRSFSGRHVGVSEQQQYVDLQRRADDFDDVAPPENGVLFLSLIGDRKAISRRREAEARIALGEAPMGNRLRALLEELPVPERRVRRESALSPAAQSLLGGTPTDRQREALDIALNTPDIALIQGPPGTGKTAVIAALQARLAELADSRVSASGRVLLSSFQHDAVEHAASKTVVFGLPPVKIGSRWGRMSVVDDRLLRWASDRIDAVRADLAMRPDAPRAALLRHIRALVTGYAASPGDSAETAHLLQTIAGLIEPHVAGSVVDLILLEAQRIRQRRAVTEGDAEALRAVRERTVRGLRVTPTSFADDGAIVAQRVLLRVQDLEGVTDADRSLLTAAAEWVDSAPPSFLPALLSLQESLLDLLRAPTTSATDRSPDLGAIRAMREAVESLTEVVRHTPEGVSDVLTEYIHDLQYDPVGVDRMLREHTLVLAATCQQSASHQFATAHGRYGHLRSAEPSDAPRPVFDTVIIDEAARANPLDLLIPMSMGQRRIILVGDHRQLPHLLEPDVERELGHSMTEAHKHALRLSLFERLFLAMQKRHREDGVQRTVTLDTQFRMHPVLGDFVSRVFYEPHDSSAVIRAGRDADAFAHDLPNVEGAVAAWLRVPRHRGVESSGRSKSRPVEARAVIDLAKTYAEARDDFSIGIIAFYSAQVDELWTAATKAGLAQATGDGEHELLPQYRDTRNLGGQRTERIRIGTVDAFQGKEFDVVILSLTRCNDIEPVDDEARRRKFGFLMVENRLCVAMSRQQRLLVVAGDDAMVAGEEARQSIAPLAAFRELCQGPHGRILG